MSALGCTGRGRGKRRTRKEITALFLLLSLFPPAFPSLFSLSPGKLHQWLFPPPLLALSHSRASSSSSSSPCSNSFAKLFRCAIEYILQKRINYTTIPLPCGNFQWTVLTRLFSLGDKEMRKEKRDTSFPEKTDEENVESEGK